MDEDKDTPHQVYVIVRCSESTCAHRDDTRLCSQYHMRWVGVRKTEVVGVKEVTCRMYQGRC